MKKIFYAFILAALFTAVSCTDVLDQTPTDQYTDAQVWQDSYLIESHLAQLYAMSAFMVNDACCIYGNSPSNINFRPSENWSANLGISAQGEGPVHTTTIADEAKYSERGAQINYRDMKLNGLQTDAWILRWWDNGYYLNRQLNHFIAEIEKSPLNNAKTRQAEARFLRAFNYFAMVKRYGAVPLITEETPIDADDELIYPARDSEKKCYDFIISECLDIADDLETNPDVARASKWAALTLASRAALYAGSIAQWGDIQMDGLLGIDSNEAENYYKTAISACEEIMSKSGHNLYKGSAKDGYVKTLEDVFLNKGNVEVIMAKHHRGTMGDTPNTADLWSWDICMSPKPNAWSVGNYAMPYYDFVEDFDFIDGRSGAVDRNTLTSKSWTMEELWGQRDPRLRAWFWTNGYHWTGAVGDPWGADTVSLYKGIRLADGSTYYNIAAGAEVYKDADDNRLTCFGDQINEIAKASLYHTGFGVAKYLEPGSECMNWFLCSTTDYVIFRYAEVLLNYAEACFEVGRTGDALTAVNSIRERAGVAPLRGITRDAIRKERKVELCFEDHRYWDVRRWRIAEQELARPHDGLTYILDWDSYVKSLVKKTVDGKDVVIRTAEPRFWLEFEDHIDSKQSDPKFPEKNYYFPIGNGTVAANDNLKENPGY